MTHSFKVHLFHLIWSTKGRQPWITERIQRRLYGYFGAIVKENGGILLEVGGMPDHIHLLIQQRNIDRFSECVRDLKANSSLWIHKTFSDAKQFAWQEGYGSFSVGYSSVEQVRGYIQNQEKHHAEMTFEEEYLKMLKAVGKTIDERFVFG